MKVSSHAGKLAEASIQVNVPRFVTAYYTELPDSSGTEDSYKIYAANFRGADNLRHIREEAQAMVNHALAGTPDGSDKS
jgi:phosphoglucomutase